MMCEYAYSAWQVVPLVLMGVLLGFALLAVAIWPLVHRLSGDTAFGTQRGPQPLDEPYVSTMPREPTLETLHDRYRRGEIDL